MSRTGKHCAEQLKVMEHRAEETVVCKPEDPSLVPTTQTKSLSMMVNAYNLGAEEVGTAGSLEFTGQPVSPIQQTPG